MTPNLRIPHRAGAVCAVIWYIAALATYMVPIGPDWLYLVLMAACAWSMVDLAWVVVAVAVRRN